MLYGRNAVGAGLLYNRDLVGARRLGFCDTTFVRLQLLLYLAVLPQKDVRGAQIAMLASQMSAVPNAGEPDSGGIE